MTRALTPLATSLAIGLTAASPATAMADCRQSPRVVGPCFTIHGRLSVANGTPSLRLHPRGSSRHLGVFGPDGDAASPNLLPPAVRAVATPATPGELNRVDGDYRVCPLARQRPGRMQPVCIAAGWRLRALPPPIGR